jgi:hypothetical protein
MHEAAKIAAGGKWTIWNQFGVQALAVTIAIVYAACNDFYNNLYTE